MSEYESIISGRLNRLFWDLFYNNEFCGIEFKFGYEYGRFIEENEEKKSFDVIVSLFNLTFIVGFVCEPKEQK